MRICDDLRQAVLQAAIQGKLTKQLPEDGNAADLLKEIAKEKAQIIKEGKIKKEKSLSEITLDEVPFDIPDNWKWCRIGHVLSMQAGKTTIASSIRDSIDDEYKYPCYGGNGVRGYKNEYNREGYHAIVGRQGALCGNINFAVGKFYATEHAVVVDCYANMNMACVGLFLKALNLNQYATATAQPGISVAKILETVFPLPPLAEQHRIVARVEELMARINDLEKTETELEKLKAAFPDDMKAALLQAAMQGKLTEQLPEDGDAADLINQIAKEKNQLIKEGRIKKEKPLPEITPDEVPFDIPESWQWVRFGSIVQYNMGKTPPRSEDEWWADDFPWVSISDMIESGHVTVVKEKVSNKAIGTFFKTISRVGTMLMSFKLTVGRVSILDIDAVHNEAIISIYPFVNPDNCLRDYLFKVLPFVTQWGDSKNAIKGKTLNSTSINNLLIPLPPLAEQKRIVEKLDKLLPLCDGLVEE